MSEPPVKSPAHSPLDPSIDATAYMVKIEDRWRAKIVNNKTGVVVWSEQDFATREECQAAFDKAMQDWGIEQHRLQ